MFCGCHLTASAQSSTEPKDLGDAARELRNQKGANPQATIPAVQNSAKQGAQSFVRDSYELQHFKDEAKALLLREKFAELDKMADTVRSSKARFPGGGWKLSRFYEAVSNADAGGFETERDWAGRLDLLRRWAAARPHSITARTALADTYLRYAWVTRGHGCANTVTDQGWRLFQERAKQSEKILADAAGLPSRCPPWYELTQEVAQALDADRSQQGSIFEKAIEFEPLYFAYYQWYATSLLPKWGGQPGETEAFAEESYRRIGGKEGAHIYFEIASNLCGRCGDFFPEGFSWQKLQEGFDALEELYGISSLKMESAHSS